MAGVEPSAIRPGAAANTSQIDGPRPSSSTAPSIWRADVATPNRKSAGRAGLTCAPSQGRLGRLAGPRAGGEDAGQWQQQRDTDGGDDETPPHPAAGADQPGEHAAQHEPEIVEVVEPGHQLVDPPHPSGVRTGQPPGSGEGQ